MQCSNFFLKSEHDLLSRFVSCGDMTVKLHSCIPHIKIFHLPWIKRDRSPCALLASTHPFECTREG